MCVLMYKIQYLIIISYNILINYLCNDKLISIVRPKARVKEGRIVYSLPEGYKKVGNFGVKVLVVEKTANLGR